MGPEEIPEASDFPFCREFARLLGETGRRLDLPKEKGNCVRAESDFPSIGERLRAALSSYQKGIGVDYELKTSRARGFKDFALLDDLGFELLALIDDRTRMNELEQLIVQLRRARTSLPSEGHHAPLP